MVTAMTVHKGEVARLSDVRNIQSVAEVDLPSEAEAKALSMEELKDQIDTAAVQWKAGVSYTLAYAIRAGIFLRAAHAKLQKDKANKKTFEEWVNENCNFSFSCANKFKALADPEHIKYVLANGIIRTGDALKAITTRKAEIRGEPAKPKKKNARRVKYIETAKFVKYVTQHGFSKGKKDDLVALIKDMLGVELEVVDELPKPGRPAAKASGKPKPKPAGMNPK